MKARAFFLLAGALAAASLAPVRTQAADKAPADSAASPAWVSKVFDLSKLHQVVVTIPAANLGSFKVYGADRVRGTISFDGTVIDEIGVRQQGGDYLPYIGINEKPSLSIKFNEFVKGQDLFGLNKLVLKDMRQDRSLVNEHLTYEVFRRAGYPAPLTAFAQVTINGKDQGIYLLREPITKQFLERNFGKGMDKGNLYEVTFRVDPATFPEKVDLKNEDEENRSRADVRALAAAAAGAKPSTFAAAISPLLDLDRFVTFIALETATSHADGYAFNVNNTYLYAHPGDGRFVFIPHGADQSFWVASSAKRIHVPNQPPKAVLAQAVFNSPELKRKYDAELLRVGRDQVWNKPFLLERVEQVSRILATAQKSSRVSSDIAGFKSNRSLIETFINGNGTTRGTSYLPQ